MKREVEARTFLICNLKFKIDNHRRSCHSVSPGHTQKIYTAFSGWRAPYGTLRNSRPRRKTHARYRTQRIRIQEAIARRTAQDGPVPERAQPYGRRTTS